MLFYSNPITKLFSNPIIKLNFFFGNTKSYEKNDCIKFIYDQERKINLLTKQIILINL